MNTQQSQKQHQDPLERAGAWYQANRRIVLGSVIGLSLVAGTAWFYLSAQERKARFAAQALEDARVAVQAGNLPLAASDLSRLVTQYAGTHAGDDAVILLAQVRLRQNNASLAVQELQTAIGRGLNDQFRAPAYGLLGIAQENVGNLREAADAYLNAAQTAWYTYLQAQYLNEAGRAFWAAGDTNRAADAYRRVISEFADAPVASEARVRLAELTAADSAVGT